MEAVEAVPRSKGAENEGAHHCAFLTLDHRGDFVIDDDWAIEPLADLGWQVSTVSWRQTEIPWSEFDLVIIRSTWDYLDDPQGFLRVLEYINSSTRLANSIELVRWNLAKTYLRDLEDRGVVIVPTLWSRTLNAGTLPGFFELLHCDEIVVKPLVGANGVDTFRLRSDVDPATLTEVTALFHERPMKVQRFMPAILREGEYSLFFFNGEFSHAILKVPAQGEFRSQEERGAEIRPVKPEERLLMQAEAALAVIRPMPLYARLDLVRREEGDFAIMECELIEPSMYLRTDPRAPARFARAIVDWFSRSSKS